MKPLHPDHDRLQSYLDGTLPADEQDALEARLFAEPSLADALVRMAREEAIIREWVSMASVAESETPSEVSPLGRGAGTPAPARRSWNGRIIVLASIGALILLVVLLQTSFRKPRFQDSNGPVLATIEDVQGAVTVVTADGRSESAERGQPLFSGDELFTGEDDSFSVVRVDESRLKLAPETRVRVGRDRQTAEPGPMFFVSEGMVDAEGFSGSVVFRSTHAELRGMEGNFSFISLPDGTYVESGEGQGRLTRQSDGRSIELKKQQTVSVKPNDDRLVSQPAPLRVTKPKRSFSTSSGPVSGLYFDPVGTSLISAAGDSLKRWDLVSGKSETAFPSLKKRPIRGFSSSSDRQLLGLAADERHVKILDAESGRELWIQKSPPKGTWKVAAIAMSRDGRSLAVSWTGKEGNVVSVMDVSLGTQRTLHTGHVGPVTLLAFSPKSQLLATGGPDRSIRLWDLADLDSVRSFTKLPQEPRSIAFSPDEKHLAIGDRKGGLRMVNPQTGSEELQLAAHLRDVLAVVFAADGQTMVTTSADGTAKLWHVGRGQELASYKSHVAGSAAFSHDGLFFATGGTDKKIHLWELPRGK